MADPQVLNINVFIHKAAAACRPPARHFGALPPPPPPASMTAQSAARSGGKCARIWAQSWQGESREQSQEFEKPRMMWSRKISLQRWQ